jgi:membrane protein required for colicin V production
MLSGRGLTVILIGVVVGMVLNHFVRSTVLSHVDRAIGFMFGLVRGAILVGLLVIACQLLELNQSRWWHESKLVPYGETVGGWLRGLVHEHMR